MSIHELHYFRFRSLLKRIPIDGLFNLFNVLVFVIMRGTTQALEVFSVFALLSSDVKAAGHHSTHACQPVNTRPVSSDYFCTQTLQGTMTITLLNILKTHRHTTRGMIINNRNLITP